MVTSYTNTFNTQNADDVPISVPVPEGISVGTMADLSSASREMRDWALIRFNQRFGWQENFKRVLELRDGYAESDKWPAPIVLESVQPPGFPVESFPRVLREFVEALSIETQTPLDLAAMLVLGMLATCLQGLFRVELGSGWKEPLCLYIAVAMLPASRKSSVFRAVTEPLNAWEARINREIAPKIESRKIEREVLQAKLDRAKNALARGAGNEGAVEDILEELADKPLLSPLRLAGDDVTQERLPGLLLENGNRFSIHSAEGGGLFDVARGRYSDGGENFDILLRAHAGDDIRVDRVNRPPEYVPDPNLTLALALQPVVIQGLVSRGFRGRGLLGRFLWSLPTSNIGHRLINPPSMPPHVRQNYADKITSLLDLGRCQTETKNLLFSQSGMCLFFTWCEHLESALGPGGELEPISDWGGKLAGATARIAGLLHLVEHGPQEYISDATVGDAIRIAKNLTEHAKIAFDLMGADERTEQARVILAWVQRNNHVEFNRADAFRALRTTFKCPGDLDKPIAFLVDHLYIREIGNSSTQGPGRPRTASYAVNPAVFGR